MYTQLSLFQPDKKEILSGTNAVVIRDLVKSNDIEILNALQSIIQISPYRHMTTPGGYHMSVATTILRKVLLQHEDIVVWGGTARLAYHGILPIKENIHPLVAVKELTLLFERQDKPSRFFTLISSK